MSTPPPLRRSSRVRAQPESYADQQAAYTLHAIEQAEVRRARQESLSFDHTDTSDEEGLGEAEVSSSGEEEVLTTQHEITTDSTTSVFYRASKG